MFDLAPARLVEHEVYSDILSGTTEDITINCIKKQATVHVDVSSGRHENAAL